MRSGIIGVPTDSSDLGIESVDAVHETRQEYGLTLRRVIERTSVVTIGEDVVYVEGRALFDDLEDVDKYDVTEDGEIMIREGKRKIPKYAKFVAVPASDSHRGFVVISSSKADFVFDMIGRQNHVTVGRASVKLGAFLRDRPDFEVDGSGATTISSNQAQTIMAYGTDLLNDDSVGDVLDRAAKIAEQGGEGTNALPTLAGRYDYDGMKAFVSLAASGYVNVYSPSLETREFLDWVRMEILPYVDEESVSEPTDRRTEAEKAEQDPNQATLADANGESEE